MRAACLLTSKQIELLRRLANVSCSLQIQIDLAALIGRSMHRALQSECWQCHNVAPEVKHKAMLV
jgi:hypothetical protein